MLRRYLLGRSFYHGFCCRGEVHALLGRLQTDLLRAGCINKKSKEEIGDKEEKVRDNRHHVPQYPILPEIFVYQKHRVVIISNSPKAIDCRVFHSVEFDCHTMIRARHIIGTFFASHVYIFMIELGVRPVLGPTIRRPPPVTHDRVENVWFVR